jgi:hypothetical protein
MYDLPAPDAYAMNHAVERGFSRTLIAQHRLARFLAILASGPGQQNQLVSSNHTTSIIRSVFVARST